MDRLLSAMDPRSKTKGCCCKRKWQRIDPQKFSPSNQNMLPFFHVSAGNSEKENLRAKVDTNENVYRPTCFCGCSDSLQLNNGNSRAYKESLYSYQISWSGSRKGVSKTLPMFRTSKFLQSLMAGTVRRGKMDRSVKASTIRELCANKRFSY